MTTVEMPTIRQYLAFKALTAMQRATRTKRVPEGERPARPALAMAQAFLRLVLHLAGFAALTSAGFYWNMIAGLVVAGLSCFVLSTLTTSRAGDNA
jgi:hypothetical protein